MERRGSASGRGPSGKGQKSGWKNRDDAPYELESQYILRLPPDCAATVRRAVQSGNVTLRDRLTIELHPDGRHGIVRVDRQPLASRLVDMPCITESLKTIDKKTFYKTADICQMLVCTTDGELYPPQEEPVPTDVKGKKRDKDKEKKFLWNHSITCPLKNVRKRRFRKTAKKKYIESPDVEKEVKRLLSTDADAVSVRWEVIAEDETKEVENQGSLPNLDTGSSPGSCGHKQGHTSAVERDELREMFNDISSSSSSDEEGGGRHEDDELNVLDSEEEPGRPRALEPGPSALQSGPLGKAMELRFEVEGLRQKLQLTQEKRKRQEDLIVKVENLALKNRLQAVVDEIKQQEEKEMIQLASLQAELDTALNK